MSAPTPDPRVARLRSGEQLRTGLAGLVATVATVLFAHRQPWLGALLVLASLGLLLWAHDARNRADDLAREQSYRRLAAELDGAVRRLDARAAAVGEQVAATREALADLRRGG
ncbi:MAG TPA: hypothetical protein VFY17_10465 [Pilimelia sp.]|nr:hypothetical protein [Pilimelia sp.]